MFPKKILLALCLYVSFFSLPHTLAFDYSFSRADIDVYDSFEQSEKNDFKNDLISAEWRLVSQNLQSDWYINYKYIKPTYGDYVEVWVKSIITNDVVKDGLGVGDYSMNRISLDCNNDQFKMLSSILYNHKNEAVIDSYDFSNYENTYKVIVPESHMNNILEEVCFMSHVKYS